MFCSVTECVQGQKHFSTQYCGEHESQWLRSEERAGVDFSNEESYDAAVKAFIARAASATAGVVHGHGSLQGDQDVGSIGDGSGDVDLENDQSGSGGGTLVLQQGAT